MLFRKIRKFPALTLVFISAIFVLFSGSSSADILDSWQDEEAYKPNPILFLHGFAQGSPDSWSTIANNGSKDNPKGLKEYFDDYTQVTTNLDLSKPYLERLAFGDPNGSIDTYPDGSDGWADKLSKRFPKLSDIYKFKDAFLKVNLVCHSMGGLAAREYLTNSKYSNNPEIDKIITIGTPHAGTPLANIKEEVVSGVHKYIIEYPPFERAQFSLTIETTNDLVGFLRGEFKIDINGEAVKDMAIASPFLMKLNGASETGVKKFAIFGWVDDPVNWIFFPYYIGKENINFLRLGDLIVPVDSQKGYDVMTNYPEEYWVWKPDKITDINANHFEELQSEDIADKILLFLDSTKPELEITSPNPNVTTEIYESSIHIQGKVYKEYLPADSRLIINVERQEDGHKFAPPESYLKPSDLWIPNDADSPVAEFDEIINFPGKGTYKISCHIKNPAGEVSDTKDVWVKVLYEGTNIIVHCHNPEGKEIGSIRRDIRDDYFNRAEIWSISDKDGTNRYIGRSARYASEHNLAYPVSPGAQTISAKWNGQEITQHIDIKNGSTLELTFVFLREYYSVNDILSSASFPSTLSESGTVPGGYRGYAGSDSKTGFRSGDGLDAVDYAWDQTISVVGSTVISHIRISATPHHNDKYFDGIRTYYHSWEVYRRAGSNFFGEVMPADAGAKFFGQTDIFNHGSSMWFVQYKPTKESRGNARFTVVSNSDYKSEFARLENWVVNYTVDLKPEIYAIKGEVWGEDNTCAISKGDATYDEVTKEWSYTQQEFDGENTGEAYFDQVYISNCPYDLAGDAF